MTDYVPFEVIDDIVSSEQIHDYPADKPQFRLQCYPSSLAFDVVKINSFSSQVILLQNTGFDPITIDDVVVVGDFYLVGDFPTFINPGQVESLTVKFVPSHAGTHTGGVYVDTGDAAGTEFVILTGSGVAATSDLLTSLIRAYNSDNGTVTAIKATVDGQVPTDAGKAVIAVNITKNITGPTTIQFNNDTALTIKKVDGSDLAAADFLAGQVVIGYISGSNFRLLTDSVLASAIDLITGSVTDAQTFADQASEAATQVSAKLAKFLEGTISVDLPSYAAGVYGAAINVNVTGAQLGDVVTGISVDVDSLGIIFDGYVSGTNNVKVIPHNITGGPIDLGLINLNVKVQGV